MSERRDWGATLKLRRDEVVEDDDNHSLAGDEPARFPHGDWWRPLLKEREIACPRCRRVFCRVRTTDAIIEVICEGCERERGTP